MYSTLLTVFAFTLAIIILVAFHEYGHFKVARLCGVKVLKFCIGFGPALYTKKDKHGTEFSIAPIPLGGFVKMLDLREGNVPPDQLQYEFTNKKHWQKIAIVLAGPIFNLILAVPLFFFMFLNGIEVELPVIQHIEPQSLAAKDGMQAGEQIIEVDGKTIGTFGDFQIALASRIGTEGNLQIVTKQFDYNSTKLLNEDKLNQDKLNQDKPNQDTSGQKHKQYSLPINADWQPDINVEPASRTLGIWLLPKKGMPMLIDKILASNANLGDLKVGDKVSHYNDKLIEDWDDFLGFVKANPGKQIKINVERQGQQKQIDLSIGSKVDDKTSKTVGQLGVMFKFPLYRDNQNYGVLTSFYKAIVKTYNYTVQTFYMIYKLFVGQLGLDTVRGPVMVAKVAGMQIQLGISNFLDFLAIISIGLGVLNLLPIPILDGGHLVYHSYEWITGKKFTEKAEKIGLLIGLLFLIFIMSVAFYNDIIYW